MTHKQLSLFDDCAIETTMPNNVVNVSSVPQRSPFRYPGGKTWLIPIIRKWLSSSSDKRLIEPFCGGGIVSLTAVCEKLVSSAIMVEKDEDVAAVWKTILKDGQWLIDKIMSFDMSYESVNKLFSYEPQNTKERAFQTIIHNRTNHGGILAKGAGRIKCGENGKGLTSRWYPATLSKRIEDIRFVKNNIAFVQGDAFDYFNPYYYDDNTYFFIDPPYTIAGRRLYKLSDIDHEQLFEKVSEMGCHYLMTYDKNEYVLSLVKKHGLMYREIPMQTTHLVKKYELLICDDFTWMS